MKRLATLKPSVTDTGLRREDDRMHQAKLSGGAGLLTRSCFLECLPYPQFFSVLEGESNEVSRATVVLASKVSRGVLGRLSFISDDISCR